MRPVFYIIWNVFVIYRNQLTLNLLTLMTQLKPHKSDQSEGHFSERCIYEITKYTEMKFSKSVFYAIAVAFGAFVVGLNLGGISGAIDIIEQEFALNSLFKGLIASSLMAGCLIGALIGGRCSDLLGRKKVLVISEFLLLLSAVGCGLFSNGAIILVIFRFVGGLGAGALSAAIPTYISEISVIRWRGTLVSLYQLFVVIGIFSAYIINYSFVSFNNNWHYMLGIPAVFAFISIIVLFLVPESPRWLSLVGKTDAAKVSARKLEFSDNEIIAILQNKVEQKEKVAVAEFFKGVTGKIVFLGSMLAFFQQITGINVVINYAPGILNDLGIADGDSLLQTVIIGASNLVFTVIALWMCDRFPRKTLLVSGCVGSALSLAYLAYAFSMPAPDQVGALIAIVSFIAFFALSLSPLMFVVTAEIYPLRIRGTAMALSTGISWACAFLVVQFYPWMESVLGASIAFGLFALFLLAAALFIRFLIPETKDKPLEEIEKYFYKK